MTFSSNEEYIVRQARAGWYKTLVNAFASARYTWNEQLRVIRVAKKVEALIIEHCRAVEELIYNVINIEFEISALECRLIHFDISVVILTMQEPVDLYALAEIEVPTCIEMIGRLSVGVDCPLIFRAYKQAKNHYFRILRKSWELRDEAIKLSYQKRTLEARLKLHLNSLGINNDED